MGFWVPLAYTFSEVLWPELGATLYTSGLHHQHGPGVWVGHCARYLWLGPSGCAWAGRNVESPWNELSVASKEWDPGAQGSLVQFKRFLWCVLIADVLEPEVREHATQCRDVAVIPCKLWLASSSLCEFMIVSRDSLGVGVPGFLASSGSPVQDVMSFPPDSY